MSENFFKINRGINLNPQTATGASDPVGADGDIYYNEVTAKFRKHENGSWTDLGGGTSGFAGAAQEYAISNGATSVTVVFPSPLAGASYVVEASFVNTVDSDVIHQSITITDKTVNGFTAKWNAPVDSSNYKIGYVIPGVQEQVGEAPVPADATSIVINIPIVLAGTSYSIVPCWVNLDDADPQHQPLTVTDKTATTFTVEWNAETDSANYRIGYRVAEYQ